MKQLLAFHIGPVQSFIISARRSRDLWFGSWLLSELSKAAALEISTSPNARLIFPAPIAMDELKADSALNVANRVVAVVEGELGDLPTQVEQAVHRRLEQLAKETFDWIEANSSIAKRLYNRASAEWQVADLPELFWVAYPIAEQPNGYREARSYVEAMMAARKATREFVQPKWADTLPKSSLDGQRESVIHKEAYADRKAPDPQKEKQEKAELLYRSFRARPAEQLSGVDLFKRLGKLREGSSFPSTSHVASLPLLARMARSGKDISAALNSYVKVLQELKIEIERRNIKHPVLREYDGSILYTNRLVEEMVVRSEDEKAATQALEKFLQETVGNVRPSPYYALLVGDGDFMGSVIDAQEEEEEHRSFSQTIGEFAMGVRATVEADFGALVYAGGDDVLAFLPLHTALHCAKMLADEFAKKLSAFKNSDGKQPTFSAGLVIAHHLEALSDVMRLGRAAEQMAKQVDGKGALAINLSKRGGADRTIVGKWDALSARLEMLIEMLGNETLPAGAAYDLHSLARRLDGAAESSADFGNLLRHEAIRILQRKRGERGKQALGDKHVEELLRPLEKRVTITALEQLAQEIIIAQHFSQAEQLANGSTVTNEADNQLVRGEA